jgi:hypothetical protein
METVVGGGHVLEDRTEQVGVYVDCALRITVIVRGARDHRRGPPS